MIELQMIKLQTIEINCQRIAHFINKEMYFLLKKRATFFDPPAVISKKDQGGPLGPQVAKCSLQYKPLLVGHCTHHHFTHPFLILIIYYLIICSNNCYFDDGSKSGESKLKLILVICNWGLQLFETIAFWTI